MEFLEKEKEKTYLQGAKVNEFLFSPTQLLGTKQGITRQSQTETSTCSIFNLYFLNQTEEAIYRPIIGLHIT